MPTLHTEDGYTFAMVMDDCDERRHAHVKGNGKGGAKLWLEPEVEVFSAGGYNRREVDRILKIIPATRDTMISKWDEECARVAASQGAGR